nr:chain length determinant protein EpsF [uncultured Massilia sp.]
MNLRQLLLILHARRVVVAGVLVATMLTTFVVTLVLPKSYEATTTLVMNFKGADPVSGMMMPAQMIPGYMATQIDIIQSKSVAMAVVDALKLDRAPALQQKFLDDMDGKGDIRDWLSDILLKSVTVVPSRESSVINLSYRASDPAFAAAVANAFANEYKKTAIQLRVQPLKDASLYFNEQMRTLRANLEQAQARMSRFQQEKGLVSVDNRLDVENARLNDLSTQLVLVQGQLVEAQSRRREVARGNPVEAPDVLNNTLIQNLQTQLVQAEARLSDVDAKFGVNNPARQSAQAEVDKLRAALAAQVTTTSNSVASSAKILQGREAEIRASLQQQKAKVLELNRTRDDLAVLTRDVDSAQRAYDALQARSNQTALEGQSNQTEIAVLSPALAPVAPSSPKMLVNMVLSLVLGMLLGSGAAIVIEMLDRRVRSRADLEAEEGAYLGSFAAVGLRPARRNPVRAFLARQTMARA